MWRQFKWNRIGFKRYQSTSTKPSVWVVTDGGLENTLHGLALGKQLAGSNQLSTQFQLKTIVASKKLQVFPTILQKYLVNWGTNKQKDALPWYLSSKEEFTADSSPDYIITSGQDSIPACLYLTNKKSYSVYLGYPGIPFINFDQVVLPKYEANAKMAALGPLARQKNGIITPAPLLDSTTTSHVPILDSTIPFQPGYTSVIVGGHSPNCRWYSEDAIALADNIKRMVKNLGDQVIVVFTDRTPEMVKDKLSARIKEHKESILIWDSTQETSTKEKINKYESIIGHAQRVILTADLDYATAHALSKQKPVYITFSGQARSYLSHFHRWLFDSHLTRKLRLDRTRHKVNQAHDPYSYLGEPLPWGNASHIFQIKHTMAFVKKEIEDMRAEKVTGKRRK